MMWFKRRPRIGIYVDAFNLYYGARDHCGRGKPGWRWLDIVSMTEDLIDHRKWNAGRVTRMVYCTALRNSESDASSMVDQETYLRALMQDARVEVVHGRYAQKRGKGIIISSGRGRNFTRVMSPGLPNIPAWLPATEVRDEQGKQQLMVNYLSHEEKSSDVNLATQLTIDVLTQRIDAAIIISNDGDLSYAVEFARTKVMVGVINPGQRPTAETLKGVSTTGKGGHWWRKLREADYRSHQFPLEVGDTVCPPKW